MARPVTIDGFGEALTDVLDDYGDVAIEKVNKVVPEVANDAVKRLRKASPRRTGEYAKNWTKTVTKSRLGATATIYGNAPTYRLAHLLEHGHAKRGGGRTAPIVHIKPVEEWAADEVESRLKEDL